MLYFSWLKNFLLCVIIYFYFSKVYIDDYQFMKAVLFRPESLTQSHKYAKSDTISVKWGIKSLLDVPISTIAVIAVIICFIFINNTCTFTHEFIYKYRLFSQFPIIQRLPLSPKECAWESIIQPCSSITSNELWSFKQQSQTASKTLSITIVT